MYAKLATLLEDLSGLPEFEVSLTGFDRSEIGALFDRLSRLKPGGEDGFDLADDLESARHRPAITQRGELLELGPHRLLCADTATCDRQTDVSKKRSPRSRPSAISPR
jgi:hypothetical protein